MWYNDPPESEDEAPTFCEQCCTLLKTSGRSSCCAGACCDVPAALLAETQCVSAATGTDSSCSACVTERTYTGYCVVECTWEDEDACTGDEYCYYADGEDSETGVCKAPPAAALDPAAGEPEFCDTDSECSGTEICDEGFCATVTWCVDDTTCGTGQSCKRSDRVGQPSCSGDSDCCTAVEAEGCCAGGCCVGTAQSCPADAPYQDDSFDSLMQCVIELPDVVDRAADPCGGASYACWQDEQCRTLTRQLSVLDPDGVCSNEDLLMGVCWVFHKGMYMSGSCTTDGCMNYGSQEEAATACEEMGEDCDSYYSDCGGTWFYTRINSTPYPSGCGGEDSWQKVMLSSAQQTIVEQLTESEPWWAVYECQNSWDSEDHPCTMDTECLVGERCEQILQICVEDTRGAECVDDLYGIVKDSQLTWEGDACLSMSSEYNRVSTNLCNMVMGPDASLQMLFDSNWNMISEPGQMGLPGLVEGVKGKDLCPARCGECPWEFEFGQKCLGNDGCAGGQFCATNCWTGEQTSVIRGFRKP
jgi:hypothetical protein